MSSDHKPDYLQDTQPYISPQPVQYQSHEQFQIEPPPRRRSGWGCFWVGCLGVVLAMVVVTGLGVFGTIRFYRSQLAKYTSETPIELPSVDITDEEVQAIVQKLDDFEEQFEIGQSPQELVITIDEINALIADNPELRGRVYVRIEDGNLRADVSIPVDEIPGGSGRYFNGSVALHAELEEGLLIVYVVDAEVNGTPIPEMFMEPFRQQNLAKDLYRDIELARTLQRCEKLVIEEDRIVLKVREKQPSADQTDVPYSADESTKIHEKPNDDPPSRGEVDSPDRSPGEVSEEFNALEAAVEAQ